jgi:hypothetical protein
MSNCIHHEIVNKRIEDNHLIGICSICGRVKDYTELQYAVPILYPKAILKSGMNMSHIMKQAKGTQKKRKP